MEDALTMDSTRNGGSPGTDAPLPADAKGYEAIVVGGGHAGCEAALALARMGHRTLLLSLNLDGIAQMSCNPAIGGVGKGQMVREIDALGGVMGRAIDATGIQFRLLNRSKGPAVQSPRAQAEKKAYQENVRGRIETTPNLDLRQGQAVRLLVEDGAAAGVELLTGRTYRARVVILTPGTFLRGTIHMGRSTSEGGRAGEISAPRMSDCLAELGFRMGRMKTGTPPRLLRGSIDFSRTTPQPGDVPPVPFSHFTSELDLEQVDCFLTSTTAATHDIIRAPPGQVAALLRPDHGRRSALLPLDRRQGREVSRSHGSPPLPRAGGA